jgi:hypothetical protein
LQASLGPFNNHQIYNPLPHSKNMLSQEEATQIKTQLFEQLKNFPEEKREQIKSQVESLRPEEFEKFLIQNNIINSEQQSPCIFCAITQGKVKSYKIDEDAENLAILEINPLGKGHTLIVPKAHVSNFPESSKKLAEKVALRIKSNLNPRDIKLSTKTLVGHSIVEIIPIFEDNPERKKASDEELEGLQKILTENKSEAIKKEIKIKKPRKPRQKKIKPAKLSPRIPD